jgi:APA family basic amino acid/polyamine antiporter
MAQAEPSARAVPKRELTLFDSTSLIVGIIIGAGIYQTAPDVARGAASGWGVLGLWAAGGLLSLCGALGYAELAAAYPREGGDYVYLTKAYGRWAGFLFGWIQLAVVRPGDIAVMAFAFATYARAIVDPLARSPFPHPQQVYAGAAVMALTAVNILGVREGKWTQNLLTVVKVLGLLAIVAVAAEVRDPKRNIVRALVSGTAAVTVIYLLVNGAFLYALGFAGLAGSEAVAADTVRTAFPEIGGRLISVLICVSALGAVNGLVLTGAR